ncbi:MAG TPA: DUF3298 domain-containing protein [Bauldia sp.]|nr:DUF3298 domain-containing protein [Bauldia sp.]
MRLFLAALAASAALAGTPAVAQVVVDTENIERKTETVDIEVAYPKTGNPALDKLFADWANDMVAGFEKSADEDFAAFKQDNNGEAPPWTYSLYLSFSVPRNDTEMLVFDFDESIFTGGAHPNHDIETFNFMMPDAWRVYLPEIFDGKAALDRISALAIADLERQFDSPDSMSDPDWLRTGAGPSWSNFEDFLLLSDRLVIRFPPYQVAAYAAGDQKVEIPLSELSGLMRDDWRIPVASFDCAKAASATEKAICSDIPLARLDRALADAYSQALSWASDDAEKTKIRDAQRKWIGERNACGGDIDCLTAAYDARLKALRPS